MKNSTNFVNAKTAKNEITIEKILLFLHESKKMQSKYNKKTRVLTLFLSPEIIDKYKSILNHDDNMVYVNEINFTISNNFIKSLNKYFVTVKLSTVFNNDVFIQFMNFCNLNKNITLQNYINAFETLNADFRLARINAK